MKKLREKFKLWQKQKTAKNIDPPWPIRSIEDIFEGMDWANLPEPCRPLSLSSRTHYSEPVFYIDVENTFKSPIEEVELFNAVKNSGSFMSLPDGIEVNGFQWVGYKEILNSLLSYRYEIQIIRISSRDSSPLDLIIDITEKNIFASTCSRRELVKPQEDAIHKHIVDIKGDFVMDCFTSITIKKFPASKKIRFYFFVKSTRG